jgi:hypothetical protein
MTLKFNNLTDVISKPIEVTLPPPQHVIVIGCGGTGAHLIPDLARAIAFSRTTPSLTLIDGDIVEERNIRRQNFIAKDKGKNKAEVLSKRYGQAFDLEISYLDKFIENKTQLLDIIDSLAIKHQTERGCLLEQLLIISCVDRNSVRMVIQEAFYEGMKRENRLSICPRVWWIDSGNEDTFGQVILTGALFSVLHGCDQDIIESSISQIMGAERQMQNGYPFGRHGFRWLPQLDEIFPEIKKDTSKAKPTISCAERTEVDPQNLLINRMAAAVVLEYAYKFLYGMKINSFMSTFDSISGETHKRLLTIRNIKDIYLKAYPDNKKVQEFCKID